MELVIVASILVIALFFLWLWLGRGNNDQSESVQPTEYEIPSPAVKSSLPASTIRMKRCDTAGVSQVEQNVFDKFGRVKDDSWNLYVPCGYTYVERELQENGHFVHKKN